MDAVSVVLGVAGGVGLGYLAGGLPGAGLALGAVVVVVLRSIEMPAAIGIALVSAGAVVSMVEGDLTRTSSFANDRPVAAGLVRSGVVVVAAAALLQLVITRRVGPAPPRPEPAVTRATLREVAHVGVIALSASVAWAVLGPDALGDDLATAVDRYERGLDLPGALDGLDAEARAAVLPVSAAAFGPGPPRMLAALMLAAGAGAVWVAARVSRSRPTTAVAVLAPALLVVSGLAPGADLADAAALGFTGLAVAGIVARDPAGVLLAGIAMGLATLSRPEAVLVVPLVIATAYADAEPRALLPSAALATYLPTAWPWWQWSRTHADLAPLSGFDLMTLARLAVPVIGLAAVLLVSQRRRGPEIDGFAVPF